ncbi:MAG TPA: rRNA maturation RNase YbeY [Mollicutes bacterium]|nr:rRNA maturation RNase YbeY [Mollicutes bacterium]
MNEISFINQTKTELKEIPTLKELISFASLYEKVNDAFFSIIFIDDKKMRELNKQYRKIDKSTDVLSFAFEDNEDLSEGTIRMLGEIYISVDRAREQAELYGHSYLRELAFLMIHGFLHLLGYDHMNDDDEKKMFDRQEVILNEFGITR